jgi:lipoprotein-releasing system permease protein
VNSEYFIAKRLISAKNNKSSIAAPIIKIAVSAIAIGIIMMIVSVATGVGLQKTIQQKIAAFSGHVIISNYTNNQSDVSTDPVSLNQPFYPKFKSIFGIAHVQGIVTKAGIIRTPSAFEGIVYKGVGTDYNFSYLKQYVTSGRLPIVSNALNNEVLISEYLANRLNLKLNSKFNTFFMKEERNKLPNIRNFQIVGIYNSGFPEFDATYIIGDIRHLQKINKWNSNQVGSFEVFIDNFSQIKQKSDQIYEQTASTLNTQPITDKFYFIFEWLKLFDFNILIIIAIMILVSTINMAVALLVLILERTQMIGILKSLGASNWLIRKIFLYNAFYLISRGLFWGNLIAITLLCIQKQFQILTFPNPEQYYSKVVPVDINIINIVLLNLLTVTICLLVLLIPSYIITKISPAKSIRFD